MLLKLLKAQWPLAVGAVVGGLAGYYGQCQSGTCIFTATWWGGAVAGLLLAAVITTGTRA